MVDRAESTACWIKVNYKTWYYFNPSLFTEWMMSIDKPFAYHKPSIQGSIKITALREAYSQVQKAIAEHCPDSRQKSIATTELETSAMWAIKAVVFNDPDSEVIS